MKGTLVLEWHDPADGVYLRGSLSIERVYRAKCQEAEAKISLGVGSLTYGSTIEFAEYYIHVAVQDQVTVL
tara:strand:- start:150 stop:362 length:213 start_codon:yes stop_codon:yes gene_type:complete